MSLIFHDDILWDNPRNAPQGPSATRDTELTWCGIVFSSVQFSRSVVSDIILIFFILIFKSKIPGHGDFTIIAHSSSNIQGVIKQDPALILCWVCYLVFFYRNGHDIWGFILYYRGFPGGAVVKNLPAKAGDAGDVGSIPGLGGSSAIGNGNYSSILA